MNEQNEQIDLEDLDDRTSAAVSFLSELVIAEGQIPYDVVAQAGCGMQLLQQMCFKLATHSGWWDGADPQNKETFGTKIALIHSEVSEAMEGGRKDTMDSHLPHRKAEEVELADAVIRILDLAGARGLDIAGAIIEKLAYNQQRADHTREHRAGAGGKKF